MSNVRFWCITLVACLAIGCAKAPTDAEKLAAAKKQAESLAAAVTSGDYGLCADLTYPKLVEKLGGRERVMAAVKATYRGGGIMINRIRIGEPQQLTAAGSEHYVVISRTLEMDGGVLKGYLLGISSDKGRSWTFIDGEGVADMGAGIKELLPSLPSTLNLPAPKPSRGGR